VALFNPLGRRIQTFIDRRFYRRKYDVRKIFDAFSARLRGEIDLDAASSYLTSVVMDTLQPVTSRYGCVLIHLGTVSRQFSSCLIHRSEWKERSPGFVSSMLSSLDSIGAEDQLFPRLGRWD
jgi:hypothetical protein